MSYVERLTGIMIIQEQKKSKGAGKKCITYQVMKKHDYKEQK
jgi:hypothetical protein